MHTWRLVNFCNARGVCALSLSLLCLAGVLGCSGTVGGSPNTPPPSNPSPTAAASISVAGSGVSQGTLGSTVQFTATVTNSTNAAVTWEVNGVAGGSSSTGTISTAGLYTPPVTVPSPSTVSITAVSQASSAASGSMVESILNPVPSVSSAS